MDYRIPETNPASGRMTGFADAAGKTSLELNPDAEPYWFETLGRVVETGEDVRFENHAEALDQWFDVYASRRRRGQPKASLRLRQHHRA